MAIIPSPLGVVCWTKSLYRSVRHGFVLDGIFVDGCDYVESPPEEGQPCCVSVLHCSTCGRTSVAWSECARCGFKPGASIELTGVGEPG